MAKYMNEIRDMLKEEDDLFLREEIPCSEEDGLRYRELQEKGEPLPNGVFTKKDPEGNTVFYEWQEIELTDAEWREYLAAKQYLELKTIRKCMVFFTAIVVIGLLIFGIPFLVSLF